MSTEQACHGSAICSGSILLLLQSTLMMALWRIVERESGSITIDGIDTLSIGLQDLRTCLALVPQVISIILPMPMCYVM